MTNQELLEKLKEDMEMRGFSHHTKDAYYRKAKETIEYFNKPIEEVSTKELAFSCANTRKGYYQICKTTYIQFAINNERLRKRGLVFLLDQYEKVHI